MITIFETYILIIHIIFIILLTLHKFSIHKDKRKMYFTKFLYLHLPRNFENLDVFDFKIYNEYDFDVCIYLQGNINSMFL